MYNIVKLNAISDKIVDVFGENYNILLSHVNPDAIIVRSFVMTDYDIPAALWAVARAGAGVNNIPVQRMTDEGVVVFNTPLANSNAVKELVVCGMLIAARDIVASVEWSNSLSGNGEQVPKLVEKGKMRFVGTEISGKTLGIVGLGAIGVKVANCAIALGMKVVGYDPYISEKNRAILSPDVQMAELNDMLTVADFLTFHVPITTVTRKMINADLLSKTKKGVVIINMSRSEIASIPELKAAIASGHVRKYVVDFPTDDLLGINNIIAIPHLGASTEEAEDACAIMAATQIKDFIENGNIVNSVNVPHLTVPRTTAHRVTAIYKTNTDALAQLKQILETVPHEITYCERHEIGYVIIDSNSPLHDDKFIEDCSLDDKSKLSVHNRMLLISGILRVFLIS
ncbi:MAG: 3-phosphoglycerate dehydrogenase [Christensenellaceae bacterium]|jgi:D-3-phosphoglycerate dehydrogenase|nr:3-phosphoglycerate dehydrogenase [Christensenellaceae bacterium]